MALTNSRRKGLVPGAQAGKKKKKKKKQEKNPEKIPLGAPPGAGGGGGKNNSSAFPPRLSSGWRASGTDFPHQPPQANGVRRWRVRPPSSDAIASQLERYAVSCRCRARIAARVAGG